MTLYFREYLLWIILSRIFLKLYISGCAYVPPYLPAVAFKPIAFVFSTPIFNTDFITVKSGLTFTLWRIRHNSLVFNYGIEREQLNYRISLDRRESVDGEVTSDYKHEIEMGNVGNFSMI